MTKTLLSVHKPTPITSDPDAGAPVPTPYPFASAPVFVPSTKLTDRVLPEGLPLHACMGLNSCAGSDRYGTAGPADGSGPNACAGQGYCSTGADHTCHVQNNCAGQGGCGLYGTEEELAHPGDNACRSMGSCATPINAERFITTGEHRGKSVWVQAREVFEAKWAEKRAKLAEGQANGTVDPSCTLPETLGTPDPVFGNSGPSYLWVSEDNADRGNMTACGATGLSGAGGCG